jgi:hypothetical protein
MGGGVDHRGGLGILQTGEISISCWQSKPVWSNPESSHYTNWAIPATALFVR